MADFFNQNRCPYCGSKDIEYPNIVYSGGRCLDCGEMAGEPEDRFLQFTWAMSYANFSKIIDCDALVPIYREENDLAQVQAQENEKNRLHNLKGFKDRNECPYCEGYGEIFDPLDLEEPHKECDHCQATGEWPTGESAEEVFKRNRFVG